MTAGIPSQLRLSPLILPQGAGHKAGLIALALTLALHCGAALAERLALLVGVSDYPSLDKNLHLNGPRNDVPVMRAVLERRGFSAANIRVLADGVSGALEPTRANILSAFDRIVAQAKQGDFIYLHFAGHGSQQPVDKAHAPNEPDGLSEIFLPRDVGRWNGRVGQVDNAIVDWELTQRLDALLAKGAFVWAVFDACHSATLLRGGDAGSEVRYRQLNPVTDLGIPQAALNTAASNAPRTRGGIEPELPVNAVSTAGKGGFVAFYAAQTTERTPEMVLPEDTRAPQRQVMGLFSYTLAEALGTVQGVSYRQLGQYILSRYVATNKTSVTPMFTGTHLDRPVFEAAGGAAVVQWPVSVNDAKELGVEGGALHGLTVGSIVSIVPSAIARNDAVVGYFKVAKTEVLRAVLEPIEHAGKKPVAISAVKDGAYARMVQAAIDLTLKVALPSRPANAGANVSAAMKAKESAAIAELARIRKQVFEGLRVTWVTSGPADVRLIVDQGQVWIAGGIGDLTYDGPHKTPSLILDDTASNLEEKLIPSLHRVAKAVNLLRLATELGKAGAGVGVESALQVARGTARQTPNPDSISNLRAGDKVSMSLTNKGDGASDITILYVDSEFGISVVYPRNGASNRIEKGATLPLDLGTINDRTVGLERVIVLSVRALAGQDRYDFSFLAQPSLDRTRGGDTRTAADPVMAAFLDAGYGGDRTRGLTSPTPPRTQMRVFSWRVGK